MRTPVESPYAAFLRIYEPLSAWPPAQRRRWKAYAERPGAVDRAAVQAAEQLAARAAVLATPPVAAPGRESDDAYVLVAGGEVLVCPWETRLRSWEALGTLQRALPPEAVHTFWPPAVLAQVAAERDRWRSAYPEARPRTRTCTWRVPAPWFALVADEERQVTLDAPRAVVFRTPMVQARRRAARALRTLRRSGYDGGAARELADVGRWLEEFHPRAWVELDYGGLVQLVDDDALRTDASVSDVRAALTSLEAGDARAAARAYSRLQTRWDRVAELERAN